MMINKDNMSRVEIGEMEIQIRVHNVTSNRSRRVSRQKEGYTGDKDFSPENSKGQEYYIPNLFEVWEIT